MYIFYKKRQAVCLSLAHVCMGRVPKCRNVPVIVYKSGLARRGGYLYKPATLNYALLACNSTEIEYLYIL